MSCKIEETSRMRPRPGWKEESADEEEGSIAAAVTLTPHTHRLLRLVQEGTTAHARLAASHLTSIAAQSSPLVLWDLLGRLVETLASSSWSCRYNAGLAMEGIARQIPPPDHRRFLNSAREELGAGLWLHIADLAERVDKSDNDNGDIGLDVVLEKGRVLLASSGTQYEPKENAVYQREADQLQRLDVSAGDRADFLKQRVQLQRHILAQRLGFGGVLESVTDDSLFSDTITNDDLLDTVSSDTLTSRREKHMERIKKRRRKNNGSDVQDESSSIRALLVMEMDQQRKFSTGATSHHNPQTLLATELIYRMFSPFWHVRHGALLGALALFKAWRLSCSNSNVFGVWPRDILARCLCVLALDRFGDYSGSFESNGPLSDNSIDAASGGVVAPVREMAGQLLSVLLSVAPLDVQQTCIGLLLRMAQYPKEWEVRHGALLAIKYIATVEMVNAGENKSEIAGRFQTLSRIAIDHLVDESDDVQGVAAQVLSCIFRGQQKHKLLDLNDMVGACSGPLWTAITSIRSVSSSGVDLVRLFSLVLCHDCNLVLQSLGSAGNHETLNSLLEKMVEFLDFDSLQVKLSALQAISVIAKPIATLLRNSASINDRTNQVDGGHVEVYCRLLENVFYSHFEASFAHSSSSEDEAEYKQVEQLRRARDAAWRKLVDGSESLLRPNLRGVKELLLSVTLRYIGIHWSVPQADFGCVNAMPSIHEVQQSPSHFLRVDEIMSSSDSTDHFATRLCASDALAYLLSKLCTPSDSGARAVRKFFHTTVSSLLHSPWFSLCEAACLLYKAFCKAVADCGVVRCSMQSSLEKCQDMLGKMLYCSPKCVEFEANEGTNVALVNHDLVAVCDRALVATLMADLFSEQDEENTNEVNSTTKLVALWKQVLSSKADDVSVSIQVSLSAVRVNATIAGAMLFLGHAYLPPKLTPMIRSLMTSLKSEAEISRQRETCGDLAQLISLLSQQPIADFRVRDKIVENICVLSNSTKANDATGYVSREAAIQVIERLVRGLPSDLNLESIPAVWDRIKTLVVFDNSISDEDALGESLSMLNTVSKSLHKDTQTSSHLIELITPSLVMVACTCPILEARQLAVSTLGSLCKVDSLKTLEIGLPCVLKHARDIENHSYRIGGCTVLNALVDASGMEVCAFVRCLLPSVMSLLTDPLEECSKLASRAFACLVRVAPLVRDETTISLRGMKFDDRAKKVVEHLIHGKPLPPYALPDLIVSELRDSNTNLRNYQKEGVAWIRFLQTVNLCGALADDMGCGKTLQALIGIAVSHCEATEAGEAVKSLVVCPSTVVGHWIKEIEKFFPTGNVFRSLSFVGNSKQRRTLWEKKFSTCNVVVTSYSFLRSDIELLADESWHYCILDEGHLLKNPKTATAMASRRISARHRLILTGTPVQNRVHELWAVFDFLMPNFLGTAASFAKEFAKPITTGHLPDASAESISSAMEKLKSLHQQVLPFILRREKAQVLKELPPKSISNIPCSLSADQKRLYVEFCRGTQGKKSLAELQLVTSQVAREQGSSSQEGQRLAIGSSVLKSLLYLRLLCTHPSLVSRRRVANASRHDMGDVCENEMYTHLASSGKLLALNELLRSAGICGDELTAADNDTSLLYCDGEGGGDDTSDLGVEWAGGGIQNESQVEDSGAQSDSKCLIFAQFSQSLDVIERFLFQPHMPSLRYLRMDGSVPLEKRSAIVDEFNTDDSIKVMLLTTRVGGLGLNLTGADTVIFLEHDWNPHVDLQAMDRCHRIGQTKTVNVYRLITSNTIEEQIMKLQEVKLAVSNAIVNTDNSTMYSMGTDRLLDIFTVRGDDDNQKQVASSSGSIDELDEMYSVEDYSSLSVEEFIRGLQQANPKDNG